MAKKSALPNRQAAPLIAIVDDDESMREALDALLVAHGFASLAFADGRAFLDDPRRAGVACLVCDVRMPGMSGPELIDRLIDAGQAIPTILITALPGPHGLMPIARRFLGLLSKPIDERALLALIRVALTPGNA